MTAFGLTFSIQAEPSDAPPEPLSTSLASASAAPSQAELIEQLSAIGYVAGTEQASESGGVIRLDSAHIAPGLNLMTSGHGPVAMLIDMNGTVLHEWRAEFAQVFPDHPDLDRALQPRRNFWRVAQLYPNGDIVVIWELFGLFKLDRNSKVLWAVPEPAHHGLQLSASGEIVHLQAERKKIQGIPNKEAIEDFIITRDADGRELRRLAISDALQNVNWLKLRTMFWNRSRDRGYEIKAQGAYDPFHTNSIWLLSPAEAARFGSPFRAGDALVSMAMLDTIAILDLEKGVTRWSQQGPFGMQHEPRITLDGDIILFNNFQSAQRSSVLALNPRTRGVVREYVGPKADPLYSKRSGRVAALPNGNTLIVETEGGRALEITAQEEVVWEYRSPFRTGASRDKVANLYSLERVDASRTSWLTIEK